MLYRATGRYELALPLAQRALAISESTEGPEHVSTGNRLSVLASLYRDMGSYEHALPLAQRALAISEKVEGPEHPSTGVRQYDLALLYHDTGRHEKALNLFQRALTISENAKGLDHPDTGRQLNNLGALHFDAGRYEQALPLLQRAQAIAEAALGPEHPRTAASLNNVAEVYRAMARYEQALPLYLRALSITEKVDGRWSPTFSKRLNNLALLYKDLGLHERALPLLQHSLAISEKVDGPEHPNTGSRLGGLAALYQSMGRYEQALPLFQRALSIGEKEEGTEHVTTARNLHNLASLHHDIGNHADALRLYERALAISERSLGPEHHRTGTVLSRLAGLHFSAGRYEISLPMYWRALSIGQGTRTPALSWSVQQSLMVFHSTDDEVAGTTRNLALAVWYGKQAVNTLQTVRGQIQGLDRELQGGFLAKNKPTYEYLANLLIESGRIAEAEQVLAMLKEREVFELTRSAGASPSGQQTTFDGVERAALAEQQSFQAEGVRQSQELASLERQRKALGTLPEADEARRQALLAQAQAWRASYQRFLASLNGRFGARAGLTREADQQSTRLQARVALDPAGAIGLHYVVTDERIGIIVATPRGSFGRFSNVSRADLERQIVALRQALFARADTRPAAQALWKMLIEPVQADVRAAGAKTLVLSLTDNLRYLPFAALQAPNGRYLVQDHALALWAAAADVTPGSGRAAWQVTGLGLSEARPGFSALPAVPQELAAIVRTSPADPDGVLPGTLALDQQFTRQRFEQALSGQANVLHVASHFDFKPGDESRSVLLLGQGEPISLGQLAVMDFSEIEQLTLSACDTATGGGFNENGAEVEGLAAIVLRQRARAVLATLWKVADASTATLMRDFYAKRSAENGHGVSRAQALRQAQLAMLQGAASAVPTETARGVSRVNATGQTLNAQPVDPARPWAHPYYWAPFVLSGNWL
jgi:CHAT domain-containing protein/Tfp pilus assembly protein PilF